MREGRLSFEDRNTLLDSMTDSVAAIVLEDNRLQALGLSIAQAGGASALPSYVRLIEIFENNGQLDRRVEGLASNEELLRRIQEGQGLRSEEHTSELQSLMRISYAVFCLKKKKTQMSDIYKQIKHHNATTVDIT